MGEPARGLGTSSAPETRWKQKESDQGKRPASTQKKTAAGDAAPEPGGNGRTPEEEERAPPAGIPLNCKESQKRKICYRGRIGVRVRGELA